MRDTEKYQYLMGALAVRLGFLDAEQLTRALSAWNDTPARGLGGVLVSQGSLSASQLVFLESQANKHLAAHGGDAERSLAAVGAQDLVASNQAPSASRPSSPADSGPPTEADPNEALNDPSATRPTSALGELPTVEFSPSQSAAEDKATHGGRYRLLRHYRQGGLGQVSVALDLELGREVALKQIKAVYAADPEFKERFVVEAEVTGRLEHPCIVPVYGLGDDESSGPYYTMRFIRGKELGEEIKRLHDPNTIADFGPTERRQLLRDLLRRFIDVCEALEFAHSRRVIHRDLKPSNILLGPHGETLVVDWGLAKMMGSRRQDHYEQTLSRAVGAHDGTMQPRIASGSSLEIEGQAIGTPAYMPPEQASGVIEKIGVQSDVYSLGAILYAILTGRPPAEGELPTILRRVREGDIDPPSRVNPSVDRALEAVCRKAMALDQSNRYSSPKALADDIRRWMDDEPVTAWREPRGIRLRRWADRHRTTAALLVLAAITAVSGYIGWREYRHYVDVKRSFERARAAVDDVTKFGRINLRNQLGLRAKLLGITRKYYDEFLKEGHTDEALAAERAQTSFQLAQLVGLLGNPKEALAAYAQALNLYRRLPAAKTKDEQAGFQAQIAEIHHAMGIIQDELGEIDEAKNSFGNGLKIRLDLVRDFPDNRSYRRDLARSHGYIGDWEREHESGTNRLQKARQSYLSALRPRERLVEEDPDNLVDRFQLARSYTNSALIERESGELRDALTWHEKALVEQKALAALGESKIQSYLAEHDPGFELDYRDFLSDLAYTRQRLGVARLELGQFEHAREEFKEAVTRYGELAAAPDSPHEMTQELAWSHAWTARLFDSSAAEHAKKAAALFQDLIKDYGEIHNRRAGLAHAEATLGELARREGRLDEAKTLLDRALANQKELIDKFPHNYDYKLFLDWTTDAIRRLGQ